MLCTSWLTRRTEATRVAAGFVIGLLVLARGAIAATAAQTTPCALSGPRFEAKESMVAFEITIDCGAGVVGASPFPMKSDLLIGLTVYGDAEPKPGLRASGKDRTLRTSPDVAAALKTAAYSKALVAGSPKWTVLADEGADSYDFAAKVVRLDGPGQRVAVRFEGEVKAIGSKKHMLFAAWPASARKTCKKASKYERSGCRRDGYVIDNGGSVNPIAAYPGLEINRLEGGGFDYTSERWIVERFR